MKNPKVTVIIPLFSQMECSPSEKFPFFTYFKPIKGCIESVKMQDYKNIELIFADKKDSKGTGPIRNAAVKKAKGEILFFLCPDAVLAHKDAISNLVKIFEKTKADVVVGGSVANKKLAPLFTYLLDLEYEDRERDIGNKLVDAGATTYFGIKKKSLEEFGGFPTKSASLDTGNLYFDSGFADWDFCGALKEKGYNIWHTTKVLVHHIYQTNAQSYFKKQFIQAWYRLAYLRRFSKVKEGYTTSKIAFQPAFFLFLPLFFILNIFYSSYVWLYLSFIALLIMFFWEIGLVIRFFKKTRDLVVFLILPVSFIRNVFWFFGILKGFWDFYIRNDKHAKPF
jgi:GT2 family glycosyltransferase